MKRLCVVESGLCCSKQELSNETDKNASPSMSVTFVGLAHGKQHGLKLFTRGLKELCDKIYQSSNCGNHYKTS